MRTNQRPNDHLRPITLEPHVNAHAEGSVLVEFGKTKVICTASLESNLPKWLQNKEQGWVSAEYGMLPRSTHSRMQRNKVANGGRTQEISRLIARCLRCAVDLKLLGEKQITVDCDVIQADGGTRTAAITGGYVALCLALKKLHFLGELKNNPIKNQIAAVSVGINKDGLALLDLDYEEDSQISTDMNFAMTKDHHFIEVQGTAEDNPFSQEALIEMMALANKGCQQLFEEQNKILLHS